MKRTLVFDIETSGHHLEYIRHLYMAAGNNCCENYVFAVSSILRDKYSLYEWPTFKNVEIHFISETQICNTSKGYLKYSYSYSKLLKQICDKFTPQSVILITLISSLPFCPFFFFY